MTFEELCTILTSEMPSIYLRVNRDRLFKLIPELEKCENFNQNSIWHPYDVLEHIYRVVDGVDNSIELRLAALFHDIGKPDTYEPEVIDGKEVGHFPRHWEKSNKIFKHFLRVNGIRLPNRKLISKLILKHDVRFKYGEDNDKLIQDLKNTFNEDGIEMLYELRGADLDAQTVPTNYVIDYKFELDQILNTKEK